MGEERKNTGIWTPEDNVYHVSCPQLAEDISRVFNKHFPTIDFGCGNGYYLNYLQGKGFKNLVGVDGNEASGFFTFLKRDLSEPQDFQSTGNVLSLEVGEHIPREYEQIFLNNLSRHSENLLLSWAVEGQPGIGHVNCRNNDYIIEQMEKRGLKFLPDISEILRDHACESTPWFSDTLMYFEK